MPRDGLAQEIVALLRTVAAKGGPTGHLIDGTVERFNNGGAERLCHITDAERDDIGLWILLPERFNLFGNLGKQIVAGEV